MFHPVDVCMIPTFVTRAALTDDRLAFLCGETRAKKLSKSKKLLHHEFCFQDNTAYDIARIAPKVRIMKPIDKESRFFALTRCLEIH